MARQLVAWLRPKIVTADGQTRIVNQAGEPIFFGL